MGTRPVDVIKHRQQLGQRRRDCLLAHQGAVTLDPLAVVGVFRLDPLHVGRELSDLQIADVQVAGTGGCPGVGRSWPVRFADFLGLPVTGRESMGEIRARVVQALTAAHTQLIVVDELQNLSGRSAGLGESVDVLKNLHNEVPATFVYAGIGLTQSNLLSGPKGQQLRGRFTTLEMGRMNLSNETDRATWAKLLNRFEKQLPLRHQEVGTLKQHSNYLYMRTSGSIGSLAKLMTGTTVELITSDKYEKETITKEAMDTVALDQYAEENYKLMLAAQNRTTKPSHYPMTGLSA